jgi:hypothetical protein
VQEWKGRLEGQMKFMDAGVIWDTPEFKCQCDREAESEHDDRPAQKKRKIDNAQARTVRDGLLAIDDLILEGPDCQDGGRDPYNESMKLLATAVGDEPIDGESLEYL